ncbi:MAG: hypothetical protein J7621_17935 [Niastella sp.]|nr:hypothetical protein [Niastella sp.]
MFRNLLFITGLLLTHAVVVAQNYHAVNGSSYAGSLGVGNNPASIVNTPFAWDIDIFSVQAKPATNTVTVHNYSFLSSPAKSEYRFDGGYYSRFAQANANVNLLNTRIALGRRAAIAAGINIRNYTSLTSSPYNFIDTLKSARAFFLMNNGNTDYSLEMTNSGWIELFGTYAQTIWDNDQNRLNAGATVRVSRGLAGAHAKLSSGKVESVIENGQVSYILKDAAARYGYSANFDNWKKAKGSSQNVRDFINNSEGGASFDLGVEFLVKEYVHADFNDNEDRYYDYKWKIGVSLMDIGFNQYKHSLNSRRASGFQGDVHDVDLDTKFKNLDGVRGFNDSLATIVENMSTLSGNFNVINPARLVINVDRYLFDAFYVNADISINLSPLAGDDRLYVRETNMIAVTPRWETRRLGFYMPILYNTEQQLRIGGAVKLGPVLFGIHNWATLFAKDRMQNGGGYLAFIVRAGRNSQAKRDRKLDCPPL